ncbi:hypothetical protein ONZ45_g9989 [Pleurotus djamor]|nr:hypothetical protein ONZ45_g9989 [Pleurotus djamor]
MYKHKNLAPSNTSLSDDNDQDGDHECDSALLSMAAHRGHWSSQGVVSYLPPEILIHILRHLSSPRDLYHCLRVSRAWCECAVELLWHKPSINKVASLQSMIAVLAKPESQQKFTYATLIRRLNFLALAPGLTNDSFNVLASCVRLERLTLVNCSHLGSSSLARVLPSCPNLVAVDLTGVVSTSDDAIVGLAHSARRLQGINLASCKDVTDTAIKALASYCPLLRRVKLSGVELITDESVSALAKSCPLLLEIDLNKCKLVTDASIRDIWLYSAHMREMRLSFCAELTDAAFPATLRPDASDVAPHPNPFPKSSLDAGDCFPPLIITRTFDHLRMLDLSGCSKITDDAIEGIISHASKIRNLVLSKCLLLTDKSVDLICRLGRHLHYLHLGHAVNITDRSVRTLARSCTRLRYVDFANCIHLTDLSVFELSLLPKLRRVGLVRVSNLTDEAVYALAERHATLERIHLSYCDRISVPAVYFLLQKLHKLTHLSLTGVPAFRQPGLQRFCRPPPKDFNTSQQLAFCVYSGKGVSQLRAFLTEYFDRMSETNGTDDTEYEDDYDGDGEVDIDTEHYPEEDLPEAQDDEMEEEFDGTADEDPSSVSRTVVAQRRTTEYGLDAIPRHEYRAAPAHNTPFRRARGSGEAISNLRSIADSLPVIEPPQSPSPSDDASNRNAPTNTNNGATFFRTYQIDQALGQSHLNSSATLVGIPVEGIVAVSRMNGALTPELNYAEIGHGRGAQSQGLIRSFVPNSRNVSGSGGGGRVSDAPQPRVMTEWNRLDIGEGSSPQLRRSSYGGLDTDPPPQAYQPPLQPDAHQQLQSQHQGSSRYVRTAVPRNIWPYREGGSPVSPSTTQQLQASLQNALGAVASPAGHSPFVDEQHRTQRSQQHTQRIPSNGSNHANPPLQPFDTSSISTPVALQPEQASPTDVDSRGRSVKRSIRNTFNAAEHYASSFLFGRSNQDGREGSSSRTPSGSGTLTR